MKTDRDSGACHPFANRASAFFSTVIRMIMSGCAAGLVACPFLHATTINATYNSASDDPPIVASFYTATGNDIQFTLNFAPATGTRLTVIRNTGLDFIQGRFDNLAQGQTVVLTYGGVKYWFTANYYGNSGRDLVLQWMNLRPFAWGGGGYGQLGNNSTADKPLPVPVNTTNALWGKLASSGSAGGGHSLGLCTDGTVVSWGRNLYGQLGNGSSADSSVPVAVTGGALAGKSVVAVSAGASHSLALCSDGKVVAWGLNTDGQLGDGSTMQRNTPVTVSTSGVLSGKTVVAISAGGYHSLALCSDGSVASWGLNANGELGNGTMVSNSSVPVAVTGGVLAGRTVIAVSAGGNHSLALCSDGTLAAWGLNADGQLGDNSTTPRNTPVAVTRTSGALLGKSIDMISAGGLHSLVLCSDGTMAAWGLNASGQLGNGNNSQSNLPVMVSNSGVLGGKSVIIVSAGANHSIAHCSDGKVATWGAGASGQLGNNVTSNSNVPVMVNDSGLDSGFFGGVVSGFSGVVSGPAADHVLALVASPEVDLSHCGFHKQITYAQSGTADPTLDPDSPYSFQSYANLGPMGSLLPSSSITPPAGGTGIAAYENGSNGLNLQRSFRTKPELDAAYPTGSYLMSIRTSTPNIYQISLPIGSDNYPPIPIITGATNATWVNGALKVTDRTQSVTVTWSNPGNDDTWFQVDNTAISKNDSLPATSFTIPGNALADNSFYRAAVHLSNGAPGTAVPGLPGVWANSNHQVRVEFMIQVGTPDPGGPATYLLIKNHNQAQLSNNDPVDAPNPLPDADRAPYAITAESPSGGNLLGPSGTSFPLDFHPDSEDVAYEYLSPAVASAATLNASHPSGTYTFPGGVAVDLPADTYPPTAKILTVNGTTPVWNAQGQLALDPTIENTITWLDVTVPDFPTQGHQSVEFVNYQDFNFQPIEMERGVLTGVTTPLTTMTIPKSSMTPTYTYIGRIGYANAPGIHQTGSGEYVIGGHETYNQFMAVALKPQTISFSAITSKIYPGANFPIGASASSGLPVTFAVVSGPAGVSGNTVTLSGTGTVTIRASQAGSGVYASAASVDQSFIVYPSRLAQFRANNGLAADGSQDLLTPAGDGVPNLLKFAFGMINPTAPGPGQASSLTVPNVQIVGTTGNAGLPRQGSNSGKLAITYIRRKPESNPGVTYAVEFSTSMSAGAWAVNGLTTETATDIPNTSLQRVTVTDDAVYQNRFARVRVTGN